MGNSCGPQMQPGPLSTAEFDMTSEAKAAKDSDFVTCKSAEPMKEEEATNGCPAETQDKVVEEPAPSPPAMAPGGQDSQRLAQEELQREMERREMERRREEYERCLAESRKSMRDGTIVGHVPVNRYGIEAELPPFERNQHVPVLGLLNPKSGAMAGEDIMEIAMKTPYYRERFFNINEVVKSQRRRGGLMDVFRIELNLAKEEARAMGTRPRLISGGGDGTGSFAVFIIFLALRASDERAEDGLADTGNGFIWTDAELAESFPALVQLPLGSANDFGNILGWGQKYPGDGCALCSDFSAAAAALYRWMTAAIDRNSRVANFDIWGIMPAKGEERCSFKIAELTGSRGPCPNPVKNGSRHLQLKEANKPVPFFVMLYFSCGFGAYMTARFQINRRSTPLENRLEYVRQAIGIIKEAPPSQMLLRLNGVEIDCETEPYFPPRRDQGVQGRRYREVGFYNINWQAHLMHGADRASVGTRLTSKRPPVQFNDGFMDMYRWKFTSIFKNPGLRVQTDKKKDLSLTFRGEKGKGIFFQWDGEARFAFSPTGDPFNIFIRKVLNIPVVLGPFFKEGLAGNPDNGCEVKFEFAGEDLEEREQVRRRVLNSVSGLLDVELLASREEILGAGLKL